MLRSLFLSAAIVSMGPDRLVAQDAPAAQFEGRNIVAIQYSPGSFLDPADLVATQPLRTGTPLQRDDVAQAIDSLFATGQFDDISVEAEAAGAGVALRFVVRPRTFVEHVRFAGKIKAPPSEAELSSYVGLHPGSPFRDDSMNAAVGSLDRLFDANGLYR